MVNLLIKSVNDAMEMCAARTRNREDFQFNREYSYTLQVMLMAYGYAFHSKSID